MIASGLPSLDGLSSKRPNSFRRAFNSLMGSGAFFAGAPVSG